MPVASAAGLLARVTVAGVAGLPDLELELGPVTALVGPRGSGKSQLLASIAWLLTGRPPIVQRGSRGDVFVSGDVRVGDETAAIMRRRGLPL